MINRQPSADLVTSTQPMSLDMPSVPQQSSSSTLDTLHDVSLIDNFMKAYAAGPDFADDSKTTDLAFAEGL